MATIREVIRGFKEGEQKNTPNGSLFTRDKVLYSYGYHYPLSWKVCGQYIVNDRGYSSSTAKHICYTKEELGEYITVELANKVGELYNIDFLISLKQEQIDTLKDDMDSLKRKNTKKYFSLESMLQRHQIELIKLKTIINEKNVFNIAEKQKNDTTDYFIRKINKLVSDVILYASGGQQNTTPDKVSQMLIGIELRDTFYALHDYKTELPKGFMAAMLDEIHELGEIINRKGNK